MSLLAEDYMRKVLLSFVGDPPDNDFQRGYHAAMTVFAKEAMGFKSEDPRCPHCLGQCNPFPEGSGYCDKCSGTGWAPLTPDAELSGEK